jgi:hypothetical protein
VPDRVPPPPPRADRVRWHRAVTPRPPEASGRGRPHNVRSARPSKSTRAHPVDQGSEERPTHCRGSPLVFGLARRPGQSAAPRPATASPPGGSGGRPTPLKVASSGHRPAPLPS